MNLDRWVPGRKNFDSLSHNYKLAQKNGRKNSRKKYWENKILAFNYMGGMCADCNKSDLNLSCYDFHHKSVDSKEYQLTSMFHAFDFERLTPELDKTVMICSVCHRRRHSVDGYAGHKKRDIRSDNYVALSPSKTREAKAAYAREFSSKNRKLSFDYLGAKCKKCGFDDPLICLYDFHHLDDEKKSFNIAAGVVKYNFTKIKSELDKCVLLCSNCHREVHGV
jgi:hypothetical protein